MPILGFGTATLGREIDENQSYALLDHAYELGFRTFDTAESYGGGNSHSYRLEKFGIDDVRERTNLMHSSEILLGGWVRSRGVRAAVEIHTKVSSNYSAQGIREALQRSLDRLQIDSADAYYLHSPPENLESAIAEIAEQRAAGRTRRIGICNAGLDLLSRAHAIAPIDLCQNVYNLAKPDPGRESIPWCHERGIAFVAYSPLGAGFLTAKYGVQGELTPAGTRFDVVPGHRDVYFQPECFAALERLHAVAGQVGVPAHRLALQWVLQREQIAIVLIGATRPEQLDNAVAASATLPDTDGLTALDAVEADY